MKYRAEIDGIRAVAVVSVVLYHAGVPGVSGGFVGVDIFFVLSGFLITTLILNAQDSDQFSLLTFYERRARRLLPALFLVLGGTIVAGYYWIPYWEFPDFMRSAAATTLFLSNVHFWENISYFGLAAEEQPLLHTWSLAVEEQFYLLFPFLLMLPMRRSVLFYVVLAIFLGSLALSQWGAINEPEVNFFFTPSRVWELMAGALCAIWQVSRSPRPNGALAFVGLVMVLLSILIYDTNTLFPSVYTLLPVGGTALLLLFAHPGTWVQAALARAPLVGIGLISYSAYLWHQPLFVFSRMQLGAPLDGLQVSVLLLVTFVLAYLTWRWVEQPVRKAQFQFTRTRSQVFSLSAVGIVACVLAFMTLDNEEHYLANLSPQQTAYLPYLRYEADLRAARDAKPATDRCRISEGVQEFDGDACLALSDRQPNVLLMGDSHASHFYDALVAAFPDANIMEATASGCRPLRDYSGKKSCTDLARFLLETYLPQAAIDTVIVSGRWRESDVPAAAETFAYLSTLVPNVIVMGPTMEYQTDIPRVLLKHADAGRTAILETAARLQRQDRPAVSRMMAEATATTEATYIDVQSFLCGEGRCRLFTPDGALVTYDYGHFMPDAAAWIINEMRDAGAFSPLQVDLGD